MTAPTTIRVTQDHIDRGQRGSWCDCPIALAIKAQWSGPALTSVRVGHGEIHLDAGGTSFYFAKLPDEADAFISDFDMGSDSVRPFQFDLRWNPNGDGS